MRNRPLIVIFVTVFVDLLGFGIVLPLLQVYAKKLEASSNTVGLLAASFSAMQFLFSPLWGRLSDRVGRRPIILLGLAGSVLFYALFGVASAVGSLTLLFVSRIGAGIAGATISTAQAYIADTTPPERRTAGMAIIGAAFAIGMTFGPLLGGVALLVEPATADGLSPMPGYVAAGISGLALAFAYFFLPESLKPDSHAEQPGWLGLAAARRALSTPIVASLLLVSFAGVFSFAKFESTLSLLCELGFGMTETQIYQVFTYIGVTLTVAQGFLVRRLATRLPEKTLSLAGVLIMAAGMGALMWSISAGSRGRLWIALPVLVTGFALLSSAVNGWLSRASRADEQGGVLGANQSLAALARILGFYLGVRLLLGSGPGPDSTLLRPYQISLGLMAIVLVLVLLLPRSGASTHADPAEG